MTFKLMQKRWNVNETRLEVNEISVGKINISFGKNAKEYFSNFSAVEVYIDEDNKMMGFKGTNDKYVGYTIFKNKVNKVQSIDLKYLPNFKIPKNRYEFTEEGMMLVIKY